MMNYNYIKTLFTRWIWTTNHKSIIIFYILFGVVLFLIGVCIVINLEDMLMRTRMSMALSSALLLPWTFAEKLVRPILLGYIVVGVVSIYIIHRLYVSNYRFSGIIAVGLFAQVPKPDNISDVKWRAFLFSADQVKSMPIEMTRMEYESLVKFFLTDKAPNLSVDKWVPYLNNMKNIWVSDYYESMINSQVPINPVSTNVNPINNTEIDVSSIFGIDWRMLLLFSVITGVITYGVYWYSTVPNNNINSAEILIPKETAPVETPPEPPMETPVDAIPETPCVEEIVSTGSTLNIFNYFIVGLLLVLLIIITLNIYKFVHIKKQKIIKKNDE